MTAKEDHINEAIHRFLQIAGKYAQIEELPIRVDDDNVISTREAHIIEAIGNASDMNVTMLADSFGVSRSAASQMVRKLEDKGYVSKDPSPVSAKEFLLSLTPMGHKAYKAHAQFHGRDKQFLVKGLSGFSLSQISVLSVLLEALGDIMDKRLESKQ